MRRLCGAFAGNIICLLFLMSDTKEWHLQPETEYRFELDPGTSLAIKVSISTASESSLTPTLHTAHQGPCRDIRR